MSKKRDKTPIQSLVLALADGARAEHAAAAGRRLRVLSTGLSEALFQRMLDTHTLSTDLHDGLYQSLPVLLGLPSEAEERTELGLQIPPSPGASPPLPLAPASEAAGLRAQLQALCASGRLSAAELRRMAGEQVLSTQARWLPCRDDPQRTSPCPLQQRAQGGDDTVPCPQARGQGDGAGAAPCVLLGRLAALAGYEAIKAQSRATLQAWLEDHRAAGGADEETWSDLADF